MNTIIRECVRGDLGGVLELIQLAFAEQKGVVDPPSSAERQTLEALLEDLQSGTILVFEDISSKTILGCVILKAKNDSLYIGKLSVLPKHRGEGIAFKLMQQVELQAKQQGFRALLLYVRICLQEQQQYYERFGFKETGLGTHEGYSEPTYMIMKKEL